MKTEKIRDCIRNTRQGSIIDAPFRDEMATEAEAELATLIDGCAWEDAAKEKIEADRAELAALFNDYVALEVAADERLSALEKQIAVKDEALSKAANLMELLQYETVSNKKKLEVWDAVKAALTPDSGKVLVEEGFGRMMEVVAEAMRKVEIGIMSADEATDSVVKRIRHLGLSALLKEER